MAMGTGALPSSVSCHPLQIPPPPVDHHPPFPISCHALRGPGLISAYQESSIYFYSLCSWLTWWASWLGETVSIYSESTQPFFLFSRLISTMCRLARDQHHGEANPVLDGMKSGRLVKSSVESEPFLGSFGKSMWHLISTPVSNSEFDLIWSRLTFPESPCGLDSSWAPSARMHGLSWCMQILSRIPVRDLFFGSGWMERDVICIADMFPWMLYLSNFSDCWT